MNFIEKYRLVEKCNEIFDNNVIEDNDAVSISHHDIVNIFRLFRLFRRASDNENISEMKNSLNLIAKILSCMLDVGSKNIFKPAFTHEGDRSFIPDDLDEDELNYLSDILYDIQQPILKARIADILWCYQQPKKIQHARLAIESYISFDFVKFSADTYTFWHRATSLAQSTKQQDYLDTIKTKLLQEIDNPTSNWPFHKLKIAGILLKTGIDKTIYADLAEKMLQEQHKFNPKSNDFNIVKDYLDMAILLFEKANNQDKKISCIDLLAKATEQRGNFKAEISNMAANHFYKLTLQIYRQIPNSHRQIYGTEQNLIDIQAKITESGKKIHNELTPIETPSMDISLLINQSINHVKDKSTLFESLCYFSGIYSPGNYQAILNGTREQLTNSTFIQISSMTAAISEDGRTIDKIENFNSDGSNQDKVIFQHAIRNFCLIKMKLAVQGCILPALNQIQQEHVVTKEFLVSVCHRSPIVPDNRENLLATALYFGFERDFSACIHLLAPQVENMIRQLFKRRGITTTHTGSDNVEDEIGLSALLDKAQAREILGDDLWFELQAVFTSSLGSNLRNMVGHGLLDDKSSNSYFSVYAWWLILKLVIRSI